MHYLFDLQNMCFQATNDLYAQVYEGSP